MTTQLTASDAAVADLVTSPADLATSPSRTARTARTAPAATAAPAADTDPAVPAAAAPRTASRRDVLVAAGIGAGALTLAACSSSSTATAAPSSAAASASASASSSAAAPPAPASAPPATGGADGAGGAGNAAPTGNVLVALSKVPVGGAVAASDANGKPIIVAQPTAGKVVAFSAICTHKACTVKVAGADLDCPCHGSKYNALTGAVINGPAPAPLPAVSVELAGGNVVAS